MRYIKMFLKTIRVICIGQFFIILGIALIGGTSKAEMLLVLLSAIMGFLVDGFAHVMVQIFLESKKRDELDDELKTLLAEAESKSTNSRPRA